MAHHGAPASTSDAVQMGTTIMAFTIDGGVMLAADSRTSRGRFVSNRGAAKLTQIAPNIGLCRSGSAADTQAVAAIMQHHMANHSIEHGCQTSVAVAANVLQSIVYANKEQLSAGMIVAGWDDEAGGQVYAMPLGGTLLKVPYAIGGSGSAYVTGWIDKHWRTNMSQEDARQFCIRAVAHAFARDGSSGGCVRLVTVTESGYKEEFVPHTQTPQMYGELPFPAGEAKPSAVVATS